MLVSGAHTEIVLCRDIADYELLGATVDDAAGEALDKAARMLGFGYPGGAVIERLATEAESVDTYQFPRPMINSGNLNFSFSGLKTALLYTIRPMSEETRVGAVRELASSFQQAVFDVLCKKLEAAIAQTGVTTVAVGGGVFSNDLLRKRVRQVVSARGGRVFAPSKKYLYVDNAAMIGVVAGFRFRRGEVATEFDLDRAPRLSL
jgi:N6-L-threonylcarbamoyladenine synthase